MKRRKIIMPNMTPLPHVTWTEAPRTVVDQFASFKIKVPADLLRLLEMKGMTPEQSITKLTAEVTDSNVYTIHPMPAMEQWTKVFLGRRRCDACRLWKGSPAKTITVKLPKAVYYFMLRKVEMVGTTPRNWAVSCFDFHARLKLGLSEAPDGSSTTLNVVAQ